MIRKHIATQTSNMGGQKLGILESYLSIIKGNYTEKTKKAEERSTPCLANAFAILFHLDQQGQHLDLIKNENEISKGSHWKMRTNNSIRQITFYYKLNSVQANKHTKSLQDSQHLCFLRILNTCRLRKKHHHFSSTIANPSLLTLNFKPPSIRGTQLNILLSKGG